MGNLRLTIQSLFLAIAYIVIYELKLAISWTTPSRIICISIIAYVLSSVLAEFLTKKLMAVKWLRKLTLGRAWVEGNWYIQTYDSNNDTPVSIGILTLTYSNSDYSLIASSYKLNSPESKIETVSRSKYVFLNPTDLSYVNYFVYTLGVDFIHGVAIGNFIQEDDGFPVRYDGKLYFFSDMPECRQIALKIPDKEVIAFKLKHGSVWRTSYLNAAKGNIT